MVAEQERGLATIVPADGLVWSGFAEYALEQAAVLDDEALWDSATSCDALVQKYQGDTEKQDELRRAQLFCEVEIAQRLGPNPGDDGKGPGKSANWRFIPSELRAKIRRFFGWRDACIDAIRTEPDCRTRHGLGKHIAKLEAKRKVRAARAQAREIVLPPGLTLDVADARTLPLDDGTVDLIVTSPPYGLAIDYTDGDIPADEWPSFMLAWLREALRVTKPSGRLALNIPLDTSEPTYRPTYVQAVVAALAAGWEYRTTVVWVEGNTTKGGWALGSQASAARPHHVSQVEMIPLFSRGEWAPSSDNPDDIMPDEFLEAGRGPWTFSGESRRWEGHPAPFPVELPRRLIRYLCRVGDVVLDPFMGSGTTAVASLALKRHAIGFDTSAAYVESAKRRLGEDAP